MGDPAATDAGSGGSMIRYEDLTTEEVSAPPEPKNPSSLQTRWLRDGAVILPRFLPEVLIDAYCGAWHRHDLGHADPLEATAYRRVPELLDLCCYGPLHEVMAHLIGESVAVHLNLVGWVSTERDFHQDAYLSPPSVGSWYIAAWFALDDISPDAGPFEWVPGSHRWSLLDQAKVRARIPEGLRDGPNWPRDSEAILTPVVERRILETACEVRSLVAQRGDVLLWHARTMHRGSRPNVPGLERRALIAHFSGINHREDMPPAVRHTRPPLVDGWQFPL